MVQSKGGFDCMTVRATNGSSINVNCKHGDKGNFRLKLINYAGQTFYNGTINLPGDASNKVSIFLKACLLVYIK